MVYVTNLEDYLPTEQPVEGSFRWAVTQKGPITILFKISGIIELKDNITVNEANFLTIAGQTAPGGGICFKKYGLFFQNSNHVIIRHLRFRVGEETKTANYNMMLVNCSNFIIDHCSFSWGLAGQLSTFGNCKNITLQWCIFSEGPANSYHPKGQHSMGTLLYGQGGYTIHHCLYANNNSRNPRVHAIQLDWVNNVIYNWGSQPVYQTNAPCFVNYRNNYIKPGPNTTKNARQKIFEAGDSLAKVFMSGNFLEGNENITRNNYLGIGTRKNYDGDKERVMENIPVYKAFSHVPTTPEDAQNAYKRVLSEAGAILPQRDAVDKRVIEGVFSGKGRIIDAVAEVGGWPAYASSKAPTDTDGDGMPDFWEKKYGFNPEDPADGNEDADGDGYTNLEEYLNNTHPLKKDTEPGFNHGAVIEAQLAAEKLWKEGNDLWQAYQERKKGGIEAYKSESKDLLKIGMSGKPEENPSEILLDLDGKTIMKLVRIPSGSFMMGAQEGEAEPGSNEYPRHKVNISKSFYMAVTQVTTEQLFAVMRDFAAPRIMTDENRDLPAFETSWYLARDFCEVLTNCTGYTFRLPTEAEWEYACRAGTTTAFNNGENIITTAEANFNGAEETRFNPKGVNRGGLIPVASFPPNAWGLYDMHGNQNEYVLDIAYRKYTSKEVTDPVNLEGNEGNRVMRGGRPTSKAEFIRSACRMNYAAGVGYSFRPIMEIIPVNHKNKGED